MGIRFNPYVAVPSMHVRWSVLVAYFGVRVARNRIARGLFLAHPFLMALAVTATGNHFFFDSVTGAFAAGLTLALLEGAAGRASRSSACWPAAKSPSSCTWRGKPPSGDLADATSTAYS